MAADAPRRIALRPIVVGVAGAVAVAAGFLAWALHRPQVKLVRSGCAGGAPVSKKVLVVYATRAGSTGEVAQAISERLCGSGFEVEVRPVDAAGSLVGYQAVVLGSAIRYSTWLPEMIKFIASRQSELSRLPLAIFTLHMQALGDDAASQDTRVGYTKAVRALLTPRDEVFLAGKVDPAALSFFERLAVRMVKSPVGDKRDWDRIRRWADGLGQKLQ
jgi:menaquinone-dependent protoporphyrinogen oxidase